MTETFSFALHARTARRAPVVISTPRGRDPDAGLHGPVGTAATVRAMLPESVRATGADVQPGHYLSPNAAPHRRADRGGWGGLHPVHELGPADA